MTFQATYAIIHNVRGIPLPLQINFLKEVDTMAKTTPSARKTKRELFTEILAISALTDEQKSFIQHEIELLNKKNGTERKPTKTQLENEGHKEKILSVLACAELPMKVADIMESIGIESNQRVTSLLTQLKNAKKVVRAEVRGKAYYTLPSKLED